MAAKPSAKSSISVPTRVTRLHNKSSVNTGAATAESYEVIVTSHQPEQFAAVLLSEDANGITVSRKKGSGSSKVLEVMIPRANILEITGNVGEQCIVRAYQDVIILRLRHQTVGYDKLGMLVATDTDTGEKTRIQISDRVSVSVVGEDVKAATGTKRPAPKPAAKSGTVSTLPTRRRPQQ